MARRGEKGHLYVVSGPSGAGKSTICRRVRKELGINLATSATTREPRTGEINGKDYFFMSKDKFLEKEKAGDFLEYATVHGNYYGTLKSEVESRLLHGEDIILEIDVQGGLQVKEKYPEAHLIFVKTKDKTELENRLRDRKTDSEETIKLRLHNSLKELEYEKFYEKTIINNSLDDSCRELRTIIEHTK